MNALHLSRQKRNALTSAVLLLAFLPTLTFLGHWDEIFVGAAPVASAVSASAVALFDAAPLQADFARHAQHCHTNLGTCTEQPMPAGVGLLITHEVLLGAPPLPLQVRIESLALPFAGQVIVPLLPPPRTA